MKRETVKWLKGMLSAGRHWEDAWNLDGAHDALATDAEVKRLRRANAAQKRALESFETDIRHLFDRREAESIIDKAKEAAIKPKRGRR